MTEEKAKQKAEELVYGHLSLLSIIDYCRFAGIKTHTESGKQRKRYYLEKHLIYYLTKIYTKGEQKCRMKN